MHVCTHIFAQSRSLPQTCTNFGSGCILPTEEKKHGGNCNRALEKSPMGGIIVSHCQEGRLRGIDRDACADNITVRAHA